VTADNSATGLEIGELPTALYDDAVALWHDAGLTRPWNDPTADLHRAVTGPASTVLCAQGDGTLLGTVMVGVDGHRGWVYYLAVQPDVRQSGIGRALMQAAETWVRGRGIPKLQLMVRTTNEDVVAFYRALGYENADVVVLGRFLEQPQR
jgi:ribosomal protein S18 acetylase RimI-like enzyme